MQVTDTLLKEFIKDDPAFRAHLLNNMGQRKSPFLVVDIGDRYRAILAGDTVKDLAHLRDTKSVERINAVVKGLAMQTQSVPTHLQVEDGTPTRDDLVELLRLQQLKGTVTYDRDFKFTDSRTYESLYMSAIQAKGSYEGLPKSIEQLRALHSAHDHSENIKKATANLLKNVTTMHQQNAQANDSSDALLKGKTLAGLGIATLATLAHHLGHPDNVESAAVLTGVVGGLMIASSELLKGTAKQAHSFLMEKSAWYHSQTQLYVSAKMNRIITDNDVHTPGALKNEQVSKLVELYRRAHPDASIEDATTYIASTIDDYKNAAQMRLEQQKDEEHKQHDYAGLGR